MAGISWITTTRAQKPRKASTSMPLLYTLVVDDAKAHGEEASTKVNAVNTDDVVFMAVSFSYGIPELFHFRIGTDGFTVFPPALSTVRASSDFTAISAVSPLSAKTLP